MMTKEIAYLHPTHTTCALVLVYLCFSLPVMGLFFFVSFVHYGELSTIVVLSGLIFSALVGFGTLQLACHTYNQVTERFGGIEILLRDVSEEA